MKFEFTDDAGNDEFIYLPSASPIVQAPNTPADFDFYSDTINDTFVGNSLSIGYTYSDYNGISNRVRVVTWYAGQFNPMLVAGYSSSSGLPYYHDLGAGTYSQVSGPGDSEVYN